MAVTGVWPTREGLRGEVRLLTNAIRTPLFLDRLDPPTPNSLTASNGKPDNRHSTGVLVAPGPPPPWRAGVMMPTTKKE